jgi:hypothetical protein
MFWWLGREGSNHRLVESKSVALGINKSWRFAASNVLKYLANFSVWRQALSSIRIQEGPPAFARFANFG